MIFSPQAGEGVVVKAIVECGVEADARIFCDVGADVPRPRLRADYPQAVDTLPVR